MICSSECLLLFMVWSPPEGQTPIRSGSIQGGNVTRPCKSRNCTNPAREGRIPEIADWIIPAQARTVQAEQRDILFCYLYYYI